MFTEIYGWLKSARKSKASSYSRPRPNIRLVLEQLEERDCPATLNWNGAAGALWSVNTNWLDAATQQAPAFPPGPNDDVVFSNAKDTNSTADVTEVKSLTVQATYTQTIQIKKVGITAQLNLALNLNVQGGTIQPEQGALANLITFTGEDTAFVWTGGTIKNLRVLLGDATNNLITTSTIAGNVTLAGTSWLENNKGTMTWASGNISFQQDATGRIANNQQGTFDIRCDATISGPNGADFVNEGGLTKTQGNAVSTIGVNFENKATITLVTGTVKFTNTATQSAGSTELAGGQLEATNGYSVSAGDLTGSGTITGNLTISGSALLRPGQGGAPGNIIVKGNYTQTGGTLQIDISAAGVISTLSVQAVGGQGGVATLGGTLVINRDEGFTPSEIGLELTFMTYASVTGDFATIDIIPYNSWVGGDSVPYRFATPKNSTNYQLVVEADD